jgi:hypothetical protein
MVEIHLLVREKRSKVITYVFKFRKLIENGPSEEIARGALTVVCVAHNADGSMASSAIPDFLASQIEVAPVEALA